MPREKILGYKTCPLAWNKNAVRPNFRVRYQCLLLFPLEFLVAVLVAQHLQLACWRASVGEKNTDISAISPSWSFARGSTAHVAEPEIARRLATAVVASCGRSLLPGTFKRPGTVFWVEPLIGAPGGRFPRPSGSVSEGARQTRSCFWAAGGLTLSRRQHSYLSSPGCFPWQKR